MSTDDTRPLPATTDDTRPLLFDEPAPTESFTPAGTTASVPGASSRDTGPTATTTSVDTDEKPHRPRLRVGTVVWGLILAAIGVAVLAWASGLAIDLQLALIVLLAVAGTVLLVGSIVSAARSSRR